jgi:phosphatidylglycerophosphate synthase
MSIHSATTTPASVARAAAKTEARPGFWAGYRRSLKPLEVEEPVDVWIHRPLAYLVARALYPTAVSPNAVTFVSILFGLGAGTSLMLTFPWHLQLGGLCIFLSAVFDCADGQLARMRGTSSSFGRMLDGVADFVVSVAAVGGATWVLWNEYHRPMWLGLAVLALAAACAVTGSFHTGMYDHFKNVYLRLTSPTFREGEDAVSARRRFAEGQDRGSFLARVAWPIYLFYVDSQEKVVHRFDPYTTARLNLLPEYDAERARVYRQLATPLMRIWRTWFGFGSLVFGIAVAAMLNVLAWYVLFRLVVLNLVFYGYMRRAQRRVSHRAFGEMGLKLPDQVAS